MKKYILCLLALSLLLAGCGKKTEEEIPELLEPVGVTFDTETVVRGDLIKEKVIEANVTPVTTALSFSIDGNISDIYYYTGDTVEAGEVIMTLDRESLTKSIEDTREQIEYLTVTGEYDDKIADLNIAILQADLDEYQKNESRDAYVEGSKIIAVEQAQLQKTQAVESRENTLSELNEALAEMESHLEDSILTAPTGGTVYFDESIINGSYVHAGKSVCYIIDNTDLVIMSQGSISEQDVLTKETYALVGDRRVEIELIEMDQHRMSMIIASGSTVKRSFSIVGDTGSIKAGDYAVIVIRQIDLKDVLLIPKDAVKRDTGGSYVYVVTNGTDREKRYISTGQNNGVSVEIKDGLKEGECIYVQS